MPRSRTIKPSFYSNEDLAECSVEARLTYPALWQMADREGRMEDRPKRIKAYAWPYDNVDILALLDELVAQKFIVRYEVDGVKYLWIKKFALNQHIHRDEAQSVIPPCPDEASTGEAPGKHRSSTVPAPCQHPSSTGEAPVKHRSSTDEARLVSVICNLSNSNDREIDRGVSSEIRFQALETQKAEFQTAVDRISSVAPADNNGRKIQDREFILRVATLQVAAAIPELIVADALETVAKKKPKTPIAYFRKVLANNGKAANHDVAALLDQVDLAPWALAAMVGESKNGNGKH